MNWIDDILRQIDGPKGWGYRQGSEPSTEPTALAALALSAYRRHDAARAARQQLLSAQSTDGSLGVASGQPTPRWPTPLAVLAWQAAAGQSNRDNEPDTWQAAIGRAIHWIESAEGDPLPPSADSGHDSTLIGWPWVLGTHSWIEPTALCLLALKATGRGQHPRARDAVQLLTDRLLPGGGCNYGNTTVLGKTLLPHLAPTGLVLIALASENDPDGRIARSREYVESTLGDQTTAFSLAWGLMGLAAQASMPADAQRWLEAAARHAGRRGASLHGLTLLTLAALGAESPLITLSRQATTATRHSDE